MVSGVIYLWLANAGLRFCLGRAGYSYLTPGNAADFFLRPWTLLALVLMAALTFVLLTLEISGLLTVYSAAASSLRLTDVYTGAVRKTAGLIRRKNFRIFGAAALWSLMINLVCISRLLTHVRPLVFIVRELSGSRLALYGAVLAVAVCAVWAIQAVYTFHECIQEQKSWKEGFSRSRELARNSWLQAVICLLFFHGAAIGTAVILYLAAVTIAVILADPFVASDLETAFLMEAAVRIEAVVTFAAVISCTAVHFAAVSVLYEEEKGRLYVSGEPRREIPAEAEEEKKPFQRGDFSLNRKRLLVLGAAVAAAAIVCLIDTAYNGNYITRSVAMGTTITAHRGSSLGAPENTLSALELAVEELADRIELDVQETADGVLVIYHDSNMNRLTGVNRRLEDMTYEELEQMDVGSWFSPEYAGEKVPTLEQVMERAKGRIDLNLDLKNMGNDSMLPEKVLDMVRRYDMMDQCVITSANRTYLKRLKELEPEIRTGYILPAAYGLSYDDEAFDLVSIRSDFVTARLIHRVHEAGKTVHTWTVNDRRELERLRALEVDDIITDDPVLAREVLFGEETGATLIQYLRVVLK